MELRFSSTHLLQLLFQDFRNVMSGINQNKKKEANLQIIKKESNYVILPNSAMIYGPVPTLKIIKHYEKYTPFCILLKSCISNPTFAMKSQPKIIIKKETEKQ